MSDSLPPLHPSSPIHSNQPHLHPRLAEVVYRHLDHEDRTPLAAHSEAAYANLVAMLGDRPLVLDSFCGTGQSSAVLAARHPDHLVVGVDKSAARLSRHIGSTQENYLLLRAPCEDIWRLLVRDGMRTDFHYIFYPNPWPKSAHLQRRVHGHASFPLLLELGGRVELRSNWQTYVEEFGCAMHLAGQRGQVSTVSADAQPVSLFEQKYRDSSHTLWAFKANIAP